MPKKIFLILLTVVSLNLVTKCNFSQENDMFNRLNSMYEKKEFFKMYEDAKSPGLTGWHKTYVDALSGSLKSRFSESNAMIDDIIKNYTESLTDSMLYRIYGVKLHNTINLGNYKAASDITAIMLSKFPGMIDSTEKADMENSQIIWKAAESVNAQTVEFSGDTKVSAKRDMAGLINIPLTVNGIEGEFVFDTGANFSVITKSYALKHNIKILDGKIKVGGMTGNKMDSELGVAEDLQIGNMIFHNVILLVMPDEVLTFAGGMYKINGIIGFPVIRAMREIHFKNEEIIVPLLPAKKDLNNLFLSGFIPVINVIISGDSLAFSFDTGAKKTILFTPYYEKYKSTIEEKYTAEEIEVGGAGENKKVQGFILDDLTLDIGGSKAAIEKIKLVKEKLLDDSKYFYGNLGQDFFSQFDEMILNFESMYVEFKK